MSRIRFLLTIVLASVFTAVGFAGPGLFKSKPRLDSTRVGGLTETLKSDPDERKRKVAAAELGNADPRTNPEVAAVLAEALQNDASASVRSEAASALGQLGQVFPVAGQALETAAANDTSPLVRLAAKRTLWDYHLNGYRGGKNFQDLATQTVEPPIASPSEPQPAGLILPVTRPIVDAPRLPPPSRPDFTELPPITPPTGPRLLRLPFLNDRLAGMRITTSRPKPEPISPPLLNRTDEPPVARPAAVALPALPPPTSPVPPPTVVFVPDRPPPPRLPDFVSTLPPFTPDLPPVVTPPDSCSEPALAPAPTPKIPPTLPPIG